MIDLAKLAHEILATTSNMERRHMQETPRGDPSPLVADILTQMDKYGRAGEHHLLWHCLYGYLKSERQEWERTHGRPLGGRSPRLALVGQQDD